MANQVYDDGNEPEPFVFRRRNINFEAPAWRYLGEERAKYRIGTRLDFRIHCYKAEIERLENLKGKEPLTDGLDDKLTGVLTKFDRSLDQYLREMAKRKSAAESKHNLVIVPKKDELLKHLRWAVRTRVFSESQTDIARELQLAGCSITPQAVSKAVRSVLEKIDLT